ncbi:AAA family ATPase [Paenibacillus sp. WLX1005]|uniref:AAA family ATPase n=1 Tax=Paenibacillus sp. WLX1005 TaxID=3243766 RepID=UPI00398444B1
MLIEFSTTNLGSFKEAVSFSMEAGEKLRKFNESNTIIQKDKRLLKNAVIFGPNGSGKSNLFAAMSTMRSIVLQPTKNATSTLPYQPFAMNVDSLSKETTYEIKFIFNSNEYSYSITHTKKKILKEKLIVNNQIYFERDSVQNCFEVPNNLQDLIEKTRDNKLFVSTAQDNNDKVCIEVITWFNNELIFFGSNQLEDMYFLLEDPKNKKLFLDFLKFADFSILSI